MIVCKAFHARRCLMLYSLAFPDTRFYVCPVVCIGITRDNWFQSEQGIDRVLGELARCGNQFVADIKRDSILTSLLRNSTVRAADQIMYLNSAKIVLL